MYQPPSTPQPHQLPPTPQPYQQPYEQPHQQPYEQSYQQPYGQSYQQSYQQPYGRQDGPRAPLATSGLAVASLVLGILWLGWIGSILAVIFGHVALRSIRRGGQRGHGLAVAGLVLGYIGVATLALVVILGVIGAAGAPSPRSQARSTAAPKATKISPAKTSGAPAGPAPAGYRWLGSTAAGVWFAVPRSWAAVNLAKVGRSQAVRHFALQGVSGNQVDSALAQVGRQHGIFAMDLASVPSSQGFAANANAFCEATPLASGAVDPSALQSAMKSAIRGEYARIHAHILGIGNATVDGDTAIRTEVTLTSAAGLTFSETQYAVLSKASRECFVTLTTGNRAALRHVFDKVAGTIHVS